MKKLISLIKATMTSDMNIFKISQKKDNKKNSKSTLIIITLLFMSVTWIYSNAIFEKLEPLKMPTIVLSLFAFIISFLTLIEGIYKTGSLLFNCKDDQLLLSLPIKKQTVLFVRIFKFYVFEFIYDSLFLIPLTVAYFRWALHIDWTFAITTITMLIFLPVIPIVISCLFGAISSSLSSRFKYKNLIQTVLTTAILVVIMFVSMNLDNALNYIAAHATSINDLITKIYYPAGVYASLADKFDIVQLLIFIGVNVLLFIIMIFILSKVYFKINSRLKKVTTTKKVKIDNLVIKKNSIYTSLVKKELNTFFKTPVFIINAGFGLVLFLIACIAICIKYNDILNSLANPALNITVDVIKNNLSIVVLALIAFTSFMTSITNSVISLEGKNINILKSLPISTKTILMSKLLSALTITTIPLLIGDIFLFIRFKLNIIEIILILVLTILIPLVSHLIGIIINLKYPKLDWENSAEVIKQSTSSFTAVMLGMLLLGISAFIIGNIVGKIPSIYVLIISLGIFLIIDTTLYLYLTKVSIKDFDKLSI